MTTAGDFADAEVRRRAILAALHCAGGDLGRAARALAEIERSIQVPKDAGGRILVRLFQR